jgi:subtilisin family serine protease
MPLRCIRGTLCAMALLAVLPAVAQPRAAPTDAVAAIRRETWNDASPTVDVIVELRDVPPFARGSDAPATSSSVQADLDRLAADLRRLEQHRVATKATATEDPVRFRRTYTRVFAGGSVRVRKELLASIRALPYVASVHLDLPVHALSERGREDRREQGLEQLGTRGAGVVVAVIDTGIDYMHPALGGGFGPGFKVIRGWDFVNDNADPMRRVITARTSPASSRRMVPG